MFSDYTIVPHFGVKKPYGNLFKFRNINWLNWDRSAFSQTPTLRQFRWKFRNLFTWIRNLVDWLLQTANWDLVYFCSKGDVKTLFNQAANAKKTVSKVFRIALHSQHQENYWYLPQCTKFQGLFIKMEVTSHIFLPNSLQISRTIQTSFDLVMIVTFFYSFSALGGSIGNPHGRTTERMYCWPFKLASSALTQRRYNFQCQYANRLEEFLRF